MSLASDFLTRARDEFPVRMVSRDLDSGGSPDMHPSLESYITDGEDRWATTRSEDMIECHHPTLACAPRCQSDHKHTLRGSSSCDICDGSGWRQRVRRRYVRPVKLSLHTLRLTRWCPKDRPTLDVVLIAFLLNEGNSAMTAQSLRSTYPFMWDRDRAERYIDYALREWQKVFREEPDGGERSENQLQAEAA